MAKLTIEKDKIPLKAFLRADSYSQHFVFKENNESELVTDEMFWGNSSKTGLYLNYSNINNRQIHTYNGLRNPTQPKDHNPEECDKWIEDNLINISLDRLIVLQGYAGSGKTTLVNYIKRIISGTELQIIDVCEKWNLEQEPYLFYNKILSIFSDCLDDVFSKNHTTRNNIWKNYIGLLSSKEISEFDDALKTIGKVFKHQKKFTSWKTLKDKMILYLDENYCERSKKNVQRCNIGQSQIILSLLLILYNAMYIAGYTQEKALIIFDNLDILSNPAITSEMVISLWSVIQNYSEFKKEYLIKHDRQLMTVSFQINVRKVLYSHIVSHLPRLEMNINYNDNYIKMCDISNLYSSQEILKHRIDYWLSHSIVDQTTKQTLQKICNICNVHTDTSIVYNESTDYESLSNINLDAFFNHNYRAFVNTISELFSSKKYSLYIEKDLDMISDAQNWQKISTLIFGISLFYRDHHIWNTLGFGCNYYQNIDFPTTINRLLLNCLYYFRYGNYLSNFAHKTSSLPSNEYLTLNELLKLLNKNKFISARSDNNFINSKNLYNTQPNNTNALIIERLADMCARNPAASSVESEGYNSEDDELWRRPIFFIDGIKSNHTALSKDELIKIFSEQILNDQDKNTKFVITDEGMILIHDIVANFEFYSARYCDRKLSMPLHHATTIKGISDLIAPVYNAVKKCIEKHDFFMSEYITNYEITKNEYLNQPFHAKTNPKFNTVDNRKLLNENSFRPQLHIVRVIYSHIAYFNDIKNLIFASSLKNKYELCERLTKWIKKYLKLYENNFYNLLEDTVCHSDNDVYLQLKVLTNLQLAEFKTHKNDKHKLKNIDIKIKNHKRN